ncbi:hypothetical protein C6P46_000681 [Rhodotorula mucilaginosa]|uniref:Potassium transporter n=1 Tax=Rhodotorula mucilaginosa TaxID=5537 RepID=A0A9P6VWH1_RHOMI|nr:hypothetical protein C6P46_000681 [Rhodotorula mucilaginosa]
MSFDPDTRPSTANKTHDPKTGLPVRPVDTGRMGESTFDDDRLYKHSLRQTLWLAFLSFGVIYGDIGTSTLYTLNGIFPSSAPAPSSDDVVGAVSTVLWTILIVPVVKYCLVALEFGTAHGEGGPLAVYTTIFPPRESKREGWRTLTTYTMATTPPASIGVSSFLHRPWVKKFLFMLTLFGVTLTIADGMLTPAVSVTSAVVGLSYGAPKAAGSVVGISCGILVVLFLIQPFGTKRIASLFSPIVFIWLALNGITGCINIAQHPAIFRAFDPSRAVMLFVRTKNYDILSGVILCITGVEALFANLGQFSKASIRTAFCSYAAPMLILQYLGQGAKLITHGDTVISNVFFNSIPGGTGGGLWWTVWIFAVLAAVIASQAMITAAFSLVQQLVSLHVMPPLRIIHTDSTSRGRIYVPIANFLLLVGTIGLTVGFGTEAGLTNAYGFAVSGVMFITTCTLAIAMIQIKHLPVIVAVIYFFAAGFIDCLFFGATLKKVPHGAWFSLGLGVVLLVLLLLWAWARGLEEKFDHLHRYRLSEVMRPKRDEKTQEDAPEPVQLSSNLKEEDIASLSAIASEGGQSTTLPTVPALKRFKTKLPSYEAIDGSPLARLPVFAVFHNNSESSGEGAPHSFTAFLHSYPALPQVIVFLSVRTVGVPTVAFEDRFLVERLRQFDGVFRATISFGYRDSVDLTNVIPALRDRIVALESRSTQDPAVLAAKVKKIDAAAKGTVTHILPQFHITADKSARRPKPVRVVRSFLLEEVYRRVKLLFDPFEEWIFNTEQDILRMSVPATI